MKLPQSEIDRLCAMPGAVVRGINHFVDGNKMVRREAKGTIPMARPKHRPRHVKGVPNATEARFAREFLEVARLGGDITSYRFEPVCFDLSDREISKCTFTPDWLAYHEGRIFAFDVKGGPIEGDAWIKAKWFVNRYRHIPLYMCRRERGSWNVERVGKPKAKGRKFLEFSIVPEGNRKGEVA